MSYLRTTVTIVAAAILLSLGSASIASAFTGKPYKNSNYVEAYFSTTTPTGTSARAYLQRSRWYGWEDLDSVSYYGGGFHEKWLTSYCKGQGTYTYRLISNWTNVFNYTFPYVISEETRFAC
jgi:hypothetical protein